ncbi:MAG TPA: dicarboxylate/amino acid:cation symporter [Vicinamibacterales bacterium]|nr:dicarboxylate/amino acid:cation symporter [Vicinamibacterales bacterium]
MSFAVRVLIGLVAGLALGVGISLSSSPWLLRLPSIVEPIGILFINAIRMTVIPLVVAGLVVGVAGTRDARTVGRLGVRSLIIFLVAVGAAAVFAAACSFPLLAGLHIDPAVAASLRESAARSAEGASPALTQVPTLGRWITDLLPANVFKAAADGAMLPLILFAVFLGLALTRVGGEAGSALLRLFKGVWDAMLVLVEWVLRFAPIGVFALAVPLAARMGLAAAGALIYYIALLSAVSAAFIIIVLYPATVLLGRVSLGRFARAAAPAQAVAFSSRSSLAALPATIEGAREGLGLPEEIVSFFLPLSASMFRVGAAMAQTVGVLFIARLYDVPLEASQLATIVITVMLTTFSVPGIPAGAIIVMAPVLAAANVPVEGLGVLLGVDTIPDMFRTMANVTGWLGGGSILARWR